MEIIIWKDIPGYEGLYRVSRCGKIKRLAVVENANAYQSLKKERILACNSITNYYRQVNLRKEAKYKAFMVHRLVAIAFIPNPENKPLVNHKDRDKTNNHVDNLEWCTQQENIQHWVDCEKAHAESLSVGSDVVIVRYDFPTTIISKHHKWFQVDKLPKNETDDWFYYNELQLAV